MKVKFQGIYTIDEFYQALLEQRERFRDLGIKHVRNANLYCQPIDEYGDPVKLRRGDNMENDTLNEIAGGLVPMRVFFLTGRRDHRFGNCACVFDDAGVIKCQDRQGIELRAPRRSHAARDFKRVKNMNVLPHLHPASCRPVCEFAFDIRADDACCRAEKISRQHDGFSGLRSGNRQHMARIFYPDQFRAKRSDQNLPVWLIRHVCHRVAGGDIRR